MESTVDEDVTVGMADGTIALEAVLAELVPTLFVALTVNVYEVPLVSPVTVMGEDAP
jgi:hypothetical protein